MGEECLGQGFSNNCQRFPDCRILSATFEETYIVNNTEYGHEIMKLINEENSDFETGTDMVDVLEDDEIATDDD